MKKERFLNIFGLLLCLSGHGFADDPFWTPVDWENQDGVRMKGLYHPAATAERYTWVLMHGLGSTKEEWDGFAKALAGKGQGVFIFDAPGHGGSQRLADGSYFQYKTFDLGQWARLPAAFGNAVETLEKKYKLRPERIAVGGASLGANAALVYAADSNYKLAVVLLLSPGVEYAGVNIDRAFDRYGKRALCLVAAPGDGYAAQTVRSFATRRTDAALKLIEGPGSAHGVGMLDASTTARILEWISIKETH